MASSYSKSSGLDDLTKDTVLQTYYRKFIDGSHVLHYHDVVDAYGHLSFRHPFNPEVFIMSRSIAPATVSSPEDLVEYSVANAEPLESDAPQGYQERYIHSEIYKRHETVQAVVHSHAESVLPYTISGVPLRPCYHMAGFLGLGGGSPAVYDADDFFQDGDIKDMLVRNEPLGEALAKCFDGGSVVALMRGHGFTAIGDSIEDVVVRAVYTSKNATIQTSAINLQSGFASSSGFGGGKGKVSDFQIS